MRASLAAVAFVAGIGLGWPIALVIGAVGVVAVLREPSRWVIFGLLFVCAGAGALRGLDVAPGPRAITVVEGPHEGVILGAPRRLAIGVQDQQRLRVERDDGAVLCVSTSSLTRVGRGDRVRIDGVVRPWAEQPVARRASLRGLGCDGALSGAVTALLSTGTGFQRWIDDRRQTLVDWYAEVVPGDAGALLAGLAVGDDDGLVWDTQMQFLTLGMTHITAVSGSNLALLTWLLMGRGDRRSLSVDLIALMALWLYVMLAGAGPATVRAGLAATLCVVAVRFGRRPDLLTCACLVAAAQVAYDPSLFDHLGYRLSTIAMLIMISTLAGWHGRGWRESLRTVVVCSIAIQLGTLAFLPSVDQAIVAGIVANSLAAPMVAVAFALAVVAGLLLPVSETAATAVVIVAELPATAILWVVAVLEGSPLAAPRPSGLGWFPLMAVRIVLVGAVVLTFGRHARRGIGDSMAALRGFGGDERLVWCGAIGGSAVGAMLVLGWR